MDTSDNQINWDKILDALKGNQTEPLNASEEAMLKDSRGITRMLEMRKKFPEEDGWQRFVAARDARELKVVWWTPAKKIAAAAAVLVLVIAGGVWYQQRQLHTPVKDVIARTDPQSSDKPYLYLSNGKKLALDSHEQSVHNNGLQIKANDSTISYIAGDEQPVVAEGKDSLFVPRGHKIRLTLPDNTTVWVNAGSRLIWPSAFTGATREVWIEGEAYFEVAANSQQPFIAHAREMDIKVLGTAFNINTYERDQLQTTLVSGKVAVNAGGKQQVITPGEQASYNDGMMYKSAVNVNVYTAWKDNELYFEDAPLLTITKQLARTFDYDFIYKDRLLEKLNFTLDMQQPANLQQVLDRIHLSDGELKFSVKERTVTISR